MTPNEFKALIGTFVLLLLLSAIAPVEVVRWGTIILGGVWFIHYTTAKESIQKIK